MNLARVSAILARFALFFTFLQAGLLVVALLEDTPPGIDTSTGFVLGIVGGLLTGGLLAFGGRGASDEFFRKEGLAVVGASWLLAGLLGAIPFVWSGALVTWADGFFEAISGLTTTGASVCGSGGNSTIEELPTSLLLWRSLLQWFGGLGIILIFLVVLPYFGVTGKNLLDSEAVGVSSEMSRPRMQEQAKLLFRLYVALTGAETLLLWGVARMPGFDALCHALTTMATGGFSTRNASIAAFDSVAVELIVVVFMFLAGANFPLMLRAIRSTRVPRRGEDGRSTTGIRNTLSELYSSPELRLYVSVTGVAIALVAAVLTTTGTGPITALRLSLFQVVSVLTSTGYATANFQLWPSLAILVLWFCMFAGGCTGSTAGGYKMMRVLLCTKLVGYALNRFINPNSVSRIKVGDEVLTSATISAALALLLLWIAGLTAGAVLLGLDGRLDLVSCLSASQSMMSCTGPAITAVVDAESNLLGNAAQIDLGPFGGFGELRAWAKIGLAFQMILGRLEILAPIVLFAPGLWRR